MSEPNEPEQMDMWIEPVPAHVEVWERMLDRNCEGYEPLGSWETGDVAQAFSSLAIELKLRGALVPVS